MPILSGWKLTGSEKLTVTDVLGGKSVAPAEGVVERTAGGVWSIAAGGGGGPLSVGPPLHDS